MLTQKDKNKIMELRSQNFSYQAVHKKLGYAIDTIMKVYNEEKGRKDKELEEGKSEKIEGDRVQRDLVSYDSSIPEIRKIESNIDKVIKSGRLKAGDKREWEKRKEDIRTTLREEVDNVRAAAVETRDEEWREDLKTNYVKKEVATNLSNTIQGKDLEIRDLKAAIKEGDNLLSEKQSEISQVKASHYFEKKNLQAQKEELLLENIDLKEENGEFHDYIGNYLANAGRREQENLRHKTDVFNTNKTDFDIHVKRQRSNFDGLFFESEEKLKSIEKRKEELSEQKEKLKKREENFYKYKKQIYNILKERMKSIEKRDEELSEQKDELDAERKKIQDDRRQVTKEMEAIKKTAEGQRTEEQRLQEWQTRLNKTGGFNKFSLPCPHCTKPMLFDATEPEINQKIKSLFGNYIHKKCRLKNEQPELVTLIPVSYSGEPIVVECSGEPVVRSGISPIIRSGKELYVFGPNGDPVSQSGVST